MDGPPDDEPPGETPDAVEAPGADAERPPAIGNGLDRTSLLLALYFVGLILLVGALLLLPVVLGPA